MTEKLKDIHESSKKGCRFCTFVLQLVECVKPGWTESTINEKIDGLVSFREGEGRKGTVIVLSKESEESDEFEDEDNRIVASGQLFLPAGKFNI